MCCFKRSTHHLSMNWRCISSILHGSDNHEYSTSGVQTIQPLCASVNGWGSRSPFLTHLCLQAWADEEPILVSTHVNYVHFKHKSQTSTIVHRTNTHRTTPTTNNVPEGLHLLWCTVTIAYLTLFYKSASNKLSDWSELTTNVSHFSTKTKH